MKQPRPNALCSPANKETLCVHQQTHRQVSSVARCRHGHLSVYKKDGVRQQRAEPLCTNTGVPYRQGAMEEFSHHLGGCLIRQIADVSFERRGIGYTRTRVRRALLMMVLWHRRFLDELRRHVGLFTCAAREKPQSVSTVALCSELRALSNALPCSLASAQFKPPVVLRIEVDKMVSPFFASLFFLEAVSSPFCSEDVAITRVFVCSLHDTLPVLMAC